MKKVFRLFLMFFLLLSTNNVFAEEYKNGFVNCVEDNSPLNVRESNSTASSIKTGLYCNTNISVSDESIEQVGGINWKKIKYGNNSIGYINGNYIAYDYIESGSNLISSNNKGYVSCYENDDPLTMRPSTTSYDVVTSLTCNTEMEIIEEVGSNYRCSNWYKVSSNGYTGYVCGTYVYKKNKVNMTTEQINSYKAYLRSIGFKDETYLDKLVTLHAEHPNWQFRAIKTNTNWDYVVSMESVGDRNLVYYTYSDGYRSDKAESYNYQTDTYYLHPTEVNWYYASTAAIKYYLDPRNFLDETNIFMFESLYYQPSYQTTGLIKDMLGSTFLANIYGNDNYLNDFIEAASTYNVSPVHLSSRILQEGNNQTSVSYGGVNYTSYNFFNIRAYGTNPQYQGLLWAAGITDSSGSYGRPWDTPKKAVLGGAQFLAQDYISVGQNNLYLEKFAVYSTDSNTSLYAHQYQQNLTAPLTEGIKSHNTYVNLNKMDSAFVFIIPVYDNMPSSTKVPYGNPNSYLKSISINGTNISNFTYNKTNYTYTVGSNVENVTIGASSINSGASISGTGTYAVGNGITKNILVTSSSGNKTTYTININREKSTNNYLNSLSVEGIDFNFNKDINSYNIEVDYKTKSVNINYTKDDSKAVVEGINSKELNVGSNIVNIVVTSESGVSRTYTLNIIRKNKSTGDELSTNNNLASLTIDKINFSFDKNTINYNLEVEYEVSSININASLEDEYATLNYSNKVNLNVGENNISINVTSESGVLKTYTLKITRKSISINGILNQVGVKYNDNYLFGLTVGLSSNSLINSISKVNNSSVVIKDKNNNILNDKTLKTGDKITIIDGTSTKNLEILIYGDVTGDGSVDKLDYLAVLRHYYNYTKYSGVYEKAADVNKDGKVDKLDYLAILRDYYGYGKVSQ